MRILRRRKVFYGWWVLLATGVAVVLSGGASTWTFPVLLNRMAEDFGSSHAQLVGALTVAGLLSTFGGPFTGKAVDRYGARLIITISLVLFGVMLMLIREVHSLWQFYLLWGIGAGFQAAVIQVATPAIAANWFLKWRGAAFAMPQVAMSVAGIVYPVVTQAITDQWGWRMVWVIMGLALLSVGAPLAWLVIRRAPEDMGLQPDGVENPALTRTEGGQRNEPNPPAQILDDSWTLREALRTRAFWLLNLGLLLVSFPFMSIIIVMHAHFTELGLSPATATTLFSFYAFTFLLGSLISATLDRFASVQALLAFSTAYYGSAVALLIIGSSAVAFWYLIILLLGTGIAASGQLGRQIFADYYGRMNLASIMGTAGLFRVVPSAVGPLLTAWVHDALGSYKPAFLLFAVMCGIAALGFAFVRRPQRASR